MIPSLHVLALLDRPLEQRLVPVVQRVARVGLAAVVVQDQLGGGAPVLLLQQLDRHVVPVHGAVLFL